MFLGTLERLTGYQVLADLSDFFLAFSGLFEGFKERSRTVVRMLGEPTTSFVLVAAPDPASLRAADGFFTRLSRERLPVGGLIVNRVHQSAALQEPDSYALTEDDLAALRALAVEPYSNRPLPERLLEAYRDHLSLSVLDASAIDTTAVARAEIAVRRVPHFNRDLHSLEDIRQFSLSLASTSAHQPQSG